jgi:tetratricopeptide (TPR) repeat protein
MNNLNRYYEILGLKPGASQVEVKEAYLNLAKTWHPDLFPNATQQKQKAESKIKEINEAYYQLKSYQPDSPNPSSQPGIYSINSSTETYYNRAMENARTGRYKEAIEDFTQAIRLNPNYFKAYKYRGLACEKLGYENRAHSDLKKATELELKQRKAEAPSASPQPTEPWLSGVIPPLVNSVAFSPQGNTLVSGSRDMTIKIWCRD